MLSTQRRQKTASGLGEVGIEAQHISQALLVDELETHGIDEAETTSILAQQALDGPLVKRLGDPLRREDRYDVLDQVANRCKTDTVLEKRHRFDENVRRCPERARVPEQVTERLDHLAMPLLRPHHERGEAGGVCESAQER